MKQASVVLEMWTNKEEDPSLFDQFLAYNILLAGEIHEGYLPDEDFFIKGKKYRITIEELAE